MRLKLDIAVCTAFKMDLYTVGGVLKKMSCLFSHFQQFTYLAGQLQGHKTVFPFLIKYCGGLFLSENLRSGIVWAGSRVVLD